MWGSVIVIPWAGGEDDVEDMDLVGVMGCAYWDRSVVVLTALFVPLVGICSFSEVELRNSFEKGVQLFFRGLTTRDNIDREDGGHICISLVCPYHISIFLYHEPQL